jgi:hypothetical protein
MSRAVGVALCALGAAAVVGCGPMAGPMPPRLEANDQKQIDDAWEQALAPVGKHDRQTWLDTFVVTQAFQVGVDSLDFRSEKKWSGGKVLMVIHCERARPEGDLFEVTVYDHGGQVLRRERYGRAEIEAAQKALMDGQNQPAPGSPEAAARDARLKKVEAVMPKK